MSSISSPIAWHSMPVQGPLLRPAAAAEYLGISVSGIYALTKSGELPAPLKIGAKASGFPKSWLDALLSEKAKGARS